MRSSITVLTLLTLASAAPAAAQLSVEVHGNFGITQVDVDGWIGGTAADSDQANSGAHAQLFFGDATARSPIFGVEAGYAYLFFYETGQDPNLVESNVDGFRAMGVGRVPVGDGEVYLEGAAGAYFVDGGTKAAVGAGLVLAINVGRTVRIPMKLRGDVLLGGDAIAVPIMASGGLSIAFGT